MTKPALIAQIIGEAYRRMLEWQYELDLSSWLEENNHVVEP